MKLDLLIEIGMEELPPSYIKPAAAEFSKKLTSTFNERSILFEKSVVFFTPRRIAVLFRKIEDYEKRMLKRIYGPPADMAFDNNGKPTSAAIGFAKSYNKVPSDLKIAIKKDKKVCYLEIKEKPKQTKEIIKEILPAIIANLTFPKKMRWEESGLEFARPIRWIVLLFGKNVIRFNIAGVTSSNSSFGPRFKGSKKIVLSDASSYERIMEKNYVISSFEKRKKMIKSGISKLLKSSQTVIEDTRLFDEVANLVEYPTVFKGEFDKAFLSLPQDVLITAMREHQRYFAVLGKGKRIEPIYIGVSNSLDDNLKEITKNHNKVLHARLNDAKFYWLEDLKKPPGERIEELNGVEWHRGLGTVFDKTMRLVELSLYLVKLLNRGEKDTIKRGALLSKTDLVTNMIKDGKEFTTLEGIIGREYALKSHEKKEVAAIISEHYLPRFPQDALPSRIESAIVGVSDRIDTLVGNFLLGEIPTGSIDPFGLRRCANGLIRIIDEFKIRFEFKEMVNKNISLYTSQEDISIKVNNEETVNRLKEFLSNRLSTYLTSLGIRYDITDAVFFVYFNDIYEAIARIKALNEEKDSKDFESLVIGQRRVANILRGVKISHKEVNEAFFDCREEKILWKKYDEINGKFSESMEYNKYKKAIKSLLSFRPHIDNFFDNCLVMTEDVKIKNNRILMLLEIKKLFDSFADFSLIVLEGEGREEGKR